MIRSRFLRRKPQPLLSVRRPELLRDSRPEKAALAKRLQGGQITGPGPRLEFIEWQLGDVHCTHPLNTTCSLAQQP
jgi:hypothetical protein